MILWRLLIEPQRYSSLQKLVPSISQRVLSQALAELAEDGVISKTGDEWALTTIGEALRPALSAMLSWGSLYQSMQRSKDVTCRGEIQPNPAFSLS